MDTPSPDPIDGDSSNVSTIPNGIGMRSGANGIVEGMDTPCPDPAEEMLHVARGAVSDFLSDNPDHSRHRDDLHGEAYLALVTVLRQRPNASEGYVFVSVKHALEEYARNIPTFSVPRSTIARCEKERRDVRELPNQVPAFVLDNEESDDLADVEFTEELAACCKDETDSTIVELKEQGYTVEEIGDELGITKGAVSKRWRKIAKRYRIRETK